MIRLLPFLAVVLLCASCGRKTAQTAVSDTRTQVVADRIVSRVDSLMTTRLLRIALDSPQLSVVKHSAAETIYARLEAASLIIDDSLTCQRVEHSCDSAATRLTSASRSTICKAPATSHKFVILVLVLGLIGLSWREIRSRR